jgi:uncharacterized protein (TIGR02217 family)
MTLISQRLPTSVEINAVRRTIEDIEIVTTDGLWEVRNARHSQPLREWDISFPAGQYASTTIEAVADMFGAARGALHTFLFKDPLENAVTDEVFGTGDGATTIFYLSKGYTAGSETLAQTITRPVSSIVLKKDGVVTGSGYTVDYTLGKVTYSVAPSNGVVLTWTGSFDRPVRFDTPLGMTALDIRLAHIDTLTLKEVRE